MEKTVEELCRELWRALDTRSKTLPYSPNVKDVMSIFACGQNLIIQVEAMVKLAENISEKAPTP